MTNDAGLPRWSLLAFGFWVLLALLGFVLFKGSEAVIVWVIAVIGFLVTLLVAVKRMRAAP